MFQKRQTVKETANDKKGKSGKKGIIRVLAAVLATFLAVPSGVYAKTYGRYGRRFIMYI